MVALGFTPRRGQHLDRDGPRLANGRDAGLPRGSGKLVGPPGPLHAGYPRLPVLPAGGHPLHAVHVAALPPWRRVVALAWGVWRLCRLVSPTGNPGIFGLVTVLTIPTAVDSAQIGQANLLFA